MVSAERLSLAAGSGWAVEVEVAGLMPVSSGGLFGKLYSVLAPDYILCWDVDDVSILEKVVITFFWNLVQA